MTGFFCRTACKALGQQRQIVVTALNTQNPPSDWTAGFLCFENFSFLNRRAERTCWPLLKHWPQGALCGAGQRPLFSLRQVFGAVSSWSKPLDMRPNTYIWSYWRAKCIGEYTAGISSLSLVRQNGCVLPGRGLNRRFNFIGPRYQPRISFRIESLNSPAV